MMRGAVQLQHQRLLRHILTILETDGYLKASSDSDTWKVVRMPESIDALEQYIHSVETRFKQDHAEMYIELGLLTRCAKQLALVMQGKQDAISLLEQEKGSASYQTSAAQLYQASSMMQASNALMQEALIEALKSAKARSRPIRVLEVGAGTGGTTAAILPVFAELAIEIEYSFTDVSLYFLEKMKSRFKNYHHITYQLLDVEKDPKLQGFAPYQYDFVIAANVLHATRDIDQTLTNVRHLVVPGGLLILLEIVQSMRWLDLTFGLLDGWWRFEDVHRRSYPLLTSSEWQKLLVEHAFDESLVVGEQQALILARANAARPTYLYATQVPWLVFMKEIDPLAEDLMQSLEALGESVVMIQLKELDESAQTDTFSIHCIADPQSGEEFLSIFEQLSLKDTGLKGILYLCGTMTEQEDDVSQVAEAQRYLCGGLLTLIQTLSQINVVPQQKLMIVTTGARYVLPKDKLNPCSATLWGMSKSLAREHPELKTVCLDLDSDCEDARWLTQSILNELWSIDQESYVALRDIYRYVYRLRSQSLPQDNLALPNASYYRLVKGKTQDALTLEAFSELPVQPGQIIISVKAAGLNFRDLLNSMNLQLGELGYLGIDCAGIVSAVGAGIETYRVGDEVMGLAESSFSNRSISRPEWLIKKPENYSFAEAATIPTVFLTVYYSLVDLAELKTGGKILIHEAADDIGLAAMQLAQWLGAEVYATVGSVAKHRYLQHLGVEHIFDSRSLSYSHDILVDTHGQGVDVVLNSLTGTGFIEATLSSCAVGARFIEISKRAIFTLEQMQQTRPDLVYHIVALDTICIKQPEKIAHMLHALLSLFEQNVLKSLPYKPYPLQLAKNAFNYMQRSNQIGKVVITISDGQSFDESYFRSDGTYLITGGLGGLGLAVAEWMVSRGARSLALLSRSTPNSTVDEKLKNFRAQGVQVLTFAVDVADRAKLASVLTHLDRTAPPIYGVIHAAGVLSDGVLLNQNWTKYETVFRAKVYGAWNLHMLTQGYVLEHFVLFSSIVAVIGSAGQVNYAAANAFLDSLAHYRRAQGFAAQSINWGAWSEIGMAAATGADQRKVYGIRSFSPEQGLQAFEAIVISEESQVVMSPMDWRTYCQQVSKQEIWLSDVIPLGFFEPRKQQASTFVNPSKVAASETSFEAIKACVKGFLHELLALPFDMIDEEQNFFEMGMDSLISMELKNRLQESWGKEHVFSSTIIFEYPTVFQITQYLSKILNVKGFSRSEVSAFKLPNLKSFTRYGYPPASPGQERFWFLDKFLDNKAVYNLPIAFNLYGALNKEALQRAIATIGQRHHILTTSLQAIGDDVIQIVSPDKKVLLQITQVNDTNNSIEALMQAEIAHPFDLSKAPLIRATLYELSAREAVVLLIIHHSVCDAASVIVLMAELKILYNAYVAEQMVELPELPIQYADFAIWQQQNIKEGLYSQSLSYWRKKLKDAPHLLNLPTDKPRPKMRTYHGRNYCFDVSKILLERAKVFSKAQQTTLFATLLSSYFALLYHYSQQTDLIVGSVVANRTSQNIEKLIGFFVNTIAYRAQLSENMIFKELLQQVWKDIQASLANAEVPYEQVIQQLNLKRRLDHEILFQTSFVFQDKNVGMMNIEMANLQVSPLHIYGSTSAFDLMLELVEVKKKLRGRIEYSTDLYDSATIESMGRNYQRLLEDAINYPDKRVGDLMLSKLEVLDQSKSEMLNPSIDKDWKINAPPLIMAAGKNGEKILQILLARGIAIDQADSMGRTPLYIAVFEGHLNIVKYLLANGADVNKAKKNGMTPLECAVKCNNREVVKELIAYLPLINNEIDNLPSSDMIKNILRKTQRFYGYVNQLSDSNSLKQAVQYCRDHKKLFYKIIKSSEYSLLDSLKEPTVREFLEIFEE